jgi:hypothetical protein
MADVSLYGLNPAGHHLTNVIIHALNAMLLFGVLRRLTGRGGLALAAAALWAVHPLRVESVVWVAERKDVLAMCFGLLAVGAHAGGRGADLDRAVFCVEPDGEADVGDAAVRAAAAGCLAVAALAGNAGAESGWPRSGRCGC